MLVRRAALAALALLALAACGDDGGGDGAAPTAPAPASTDRSAPGAGSTVVTRTPLPGFEDVLVEVELAGGEVRRFCLLLADDPATRARGLMEVEDPALGGHDGMLFRFDADTEGPFWMRNTPLPLSIAFVAADGRTVSTAEMEPCADVPDCPTYEPDGPYRMAVEVPIAAGGVEALGLPDGRLRDTGRQCPPLG